MGRGSWAIAMAILNMSLNAMIFASYGSHEGNVRLEQHEHVRIAPTKHPDDVPKLCYWLGCSWTPKQRIQQPWLISFRASQSVRIVLFKVKRTTLLPVGISFFLSDANISDFTNCTSRFRVNSTLVHGLTKRVPYSLTLRPQRDLQTGKITAIDTVVCDHWDLYG